MASNSQTSFPAQLLDEIGYFTAPARPDTHISDKWIASSLLQKSIRRGELHHALNAAASIYKNDPRAVWRRLAVVAWEDVTFGDTNGCIAAFELGRSKRIRQKLGGEWHTIAWCVDRFCKAAKNRVTDDLITIIEHAPSLPRVISKLNGLDRQGLSQLAYPSDRCTLQRAIAVWLLMGTDRFQSEAMPERIGDVPAFFDGFAPGSLEPFLKQIGCRASRATRTIFPAIMAMLWQEWAKSASQCKIVQDQLIWQEQIGDIPKYVFDGHTAKGSRYLRKLLRLDDELAWWLHEYLPSEQHVSAVKKFCFRSVASLCDNRQNWGEVEKLRQQADAVGFRLPLEVFAEGKLIFERASLRFPMEEVG